MSSRRNLRRLAEKFNRSQSGNVATIFAMSLVPVLGLFGAAIDYSQAARDRATLQAAYDAAALAGARQLRNGDAAVRQAVNNYLQANLPQNLQSTPTQTNILENRSTVQVKSAGPVQMQTSFLGVLGVTRLSYNVEAQTTLGAREVEVALVLDNTGSMSRDMPALRAAAVRLAGDLMATSPDVRVAVVPYVAAVNPGRAAIPMSMVDVLAQSRHHAEHLRERYIGRTTDGCKFPWENPNPNPGGGGGGGGGGNDNPDRGGGGSDRSDFWNPLRSIASAVGQMFGVASARAAGPDVTPSTRRPYQGIWIRNNTAFVPDGFPNWNDCGLHNPQRISHLDLFARIPNARWKGCVEARPEPFDVTDDAPTAGNPNTLFVPYFAPDEQDPDSPNRVFISGPGVGQMANSYMPDGPIDGGGFRIFGPQGFKFPGDWEQTYSILKYDGVNRAHIAEAGNARNFGPNAYCPDEILPLTNNANTVRAKINGLSYWPGGGTITSEGVAWGWRVLSPGPPFTEGKPYGDVPKIMVVMSDGLNSLVQNDRNGASMSDYTAYGWLRNGRFPRERFDSSTEYLNQRMQEVCTNAKRAGITIYSVLFRERDSEARRVMRECSTDGRLYYEAVNASELDRAFADIGAQISKLRVKK